jgi:hypothetical protein
MPSVFLGVAVFCGTGYQPESGHGLITNHAFGLENQVSIPGFAISTRIGQLERGRPRASRPCHKRWPHPVFLRKEFTLTQIPARGPSGRSCPPPCSACRCCSACGERRKRISSFRRFPGRHLRQSLLHAAAVTEKGKQDAQAKRNAGRHLPTLPPAPARAANRSIFSARSRTSYAC